MRGAVSRGDALSALGCAESFALRGLEPRDIPACGRIPRALPEWFGIDGRIAGFVALEEHSPKPLEIHVTGVEPLFESLALWGPENAALVLVMRV